MTRPDLRASARKHRKLLVIALSMFLVYTLIGFLVVPWIAQRQLVRIVEETLDLRASVERLQTNPYTFTVKAEGFVLREPDGAELLGFDELFVNLQLSSLFRWAWTLKEVRLVNPRVDVILDESGRVNLESLVPQQTQSDETAEAGGLPRLLVHVFELESGRARFEDRTRPTPFQTEAGPVSFSLNHFSTLPGDDGDLAFEAALESGAHFTWHGTIGVAPPHSEGRITLASGHMPITKRYLQDMLRFHVVDGRSDAELAYEASLVGEDVRVTLSDGVVTVRDLVVTPENDDVELLRLPELRLSGIGLEWPQKELAVEELALTGVRLAAWRNPDGSLNLLEHPAVETASGAGAGEAESQPPESEAASPLDGWRISLERLVVNDLAVDVEDRTVDPPFRTGVGGVRLEVRDIDNAPGSTFDFTLAAAVDTGGSASAGGRMGVLPEPTLDAAVKLDGLSLVPLQAYLAELARLRIDSGAVSLDGHLTSSAEEVLAYRGGVELAGFACQDVGKNERLIGLGRMGADDLLLELTAARLRIAVLDLERPYGRLAIYDNGTTNIGDVLADDTDGTSDVATSEGSSAAAAELPLTIEIGEVRLRDGSVDFADLSLPLPFVSRIESLEGAISEIATGGTSARVELEGTVDEYGLARVEGSLDFFAFDRRSDVAVTFRNVEMSRLSPYSSKFAGYEVEEGRLSLDLRYRIQDRTFDSENEILVERLTLGEKFDSPDAPKLPIKLAVAMLKDKDGNIELNIPVAGTLDDPEFAYGKLVWRAVKGVMKKVATAPFRALARLVGSDKDLEVVEFAPADTEITPPAREKLEQLTQALGERPELVLELRGVFDPEIDGAGIREQKVAALVAEHVESLPQPEGAEPALASEQNRTALEALFRERFSQEELDGLVTSHSVPIEPTGDDSPPAEEPAEPVLDLAAYLDAARERLLAAQPVSDDELVNLADARAAAIGDYLTDGGVVHAEQVRTVGGGPIKKKDSGNNWVRLRLVLIPK